MSTRGNVLFTDSYYLNDNDIKTEDIENSTRVLEGVIENSLKIYIHSDMYPVHYGKDANGNKAVVGALPLLQTYLQLDGAKHRAHNTSYLAAWFVGYKCMQMIPYTRAMTSEERIEPNKIHKTYGNMKKSRDFFGVGLLQECVDFAEYNYIIVPKLAKKQNHYNYQNSFDILVFDYQFKHIKTINSEDDIWDYENSW